MCVLDCVLVVDVWWMAIGLGVVLVLCRTNNVDVVVFMLQYLSNTVVTRPIS